MIVSSPLSSPAVTPPVGNTQSERQMASRAAAVDTPPAQNVAVMSATDAPTQPKPEELAQAVKAVNEFVKPFNNALNFSVDPESKTTVVKVVDQSTKEVIRQIPSEEMLALAKALDTMKGLLIRQKA